VRANLAILPRFSNAFPNRFIRHLNPPIQHHFLEVSVAQGKGVVEPNAVADDFAGEAITGVHGLGIVN